MKGTAIDTRSRNIALMLALALALPLSAGCSSGAPSAEQDADAVEQTKEEEVKPTEEDESVTEEDIAVTEEEDEEETAVEAPAATQRVGADGIGYVSVPNNWVEFKDVDGNSSIQWCDGTPYTIISLNTFDMSSVPEDQRADFDVEDAANSVWVNMLNDGLEEDAIQGARVTLADHDALQVYGLYPDGSFLVCWLLDDGSGTIRYVSAEGPESTIYDTVEMIQNTYEL